MTTAIPPKGTPDLDAERPADGTSDYAQSPMAEATPGTPARPVEGSFDRPMDTTPSHATPLHATPPRASTDAAPAADDEIVRAADGSSDYEHSDMAAAVDEARHKPK